MQQDKSTERTESIHKLDTPRKDKLKQFFKTAGHLMKQGTYRGQSILNGVVGNHLVEHADALAIPMQLRHAGTKLPLDKISLKNAYPGATSSLCILIHGLTDDEHIWSYRKNRSKDYGSLLQKDLSFTPVYLRYNTGLHISENGQKLSDLIEELLRNYPVKIKEIAIIAHSMGGLVSRSAGQYASRQNAKWIKKLTDLITIGTPHLGAPMEKLGHIATRTLLTLPLLSTRLVGRVANLRSDGIKDLRHGYTEDEEWNEGSQDRWISFNKSIAKKLKHVHYYAIGGSLTKNAGNPVTVTLGDSLVRRSSATGESMLPDFNLDLPPENTKEFPGFAHLKLAHHPAVYRQIRKWLRRNR